MGDVTLFKSIEPHIKAAVKAFTGISWSMMLESHPNPPFSFKMGTAGSLVPENYSGELKSQPDFEEEPPF
jgi:hypothetical protein